MIWKSNQYLSMDNIKGIAHSQWEWSWRGPLLRTLCSSLIVTFFITCYHVNVIVSVLVNSCLGNLKFLFYLWRKTIIVAYRPPKPNFSLQKFKDIIQQIRKYLRKWCLQHYYGWWLQFSFESGRVDNKRWCRLALILLRVWNQCLTTTWYHSHWMSPIWKLITIILKTNLLTQKSQTSTSKVLMFKVR